MHFYINKELSPKGDQRKVIDSISKGVKKDLDFQTIVGATGTGKTYVMAKIIEATNKPALILAHNKTLAAQLFREFKYFFPQNHVEYFVSYYDYYQPEAYVAKRDLYIEKDASINEEIDRMRLRATASLIEKRDVVIVSSVSCIYGLGSPDHYKNMYVSLQVGSLMNRKTIMERLVNIQYQRNDNVFSRGTFRVRGDVLDIHLAYRDMGVRVELFGDEIERITLIDVLSNQAIESKKFFMIFPAKHFVMPEEKMGKALDEITKELEEQARYFQGQNKILEKERLESRTKYDLELMRTVGHCPGVENYSRHLSGRKEGEAPDTLLDYFLDDFITFIDESHVTLPQLRGMFNGDRKRKESLVNYGFRLPSALDNRPLYLEEFIQKKTGSIVFVSATPQEYEKKMSVNTASLINRPTGLLDPVITIKPSEGQIDDLFMEIKQAISQNNRVLITTLTKKMAEDLTLFLKEHQIKVNYLHSDIETIERVEIIKSLREGSIDVLVGINLLREGLDLPEVSVVAILDADKIGFLRSKTSLIQTIGRAARNIDGKAIMYADKISDAMKECIEETKKRREIQMEFNQKNNITPKSITKKISDILVRENKKETENDLEKRNGQISLKVKNKKEAQALLKKLDFDMRLAGDHLDFEKAIELREAIKKLKLKMSL